MIKKIILFVLGLMVIVAMSATLLSKENSKPDTKELVKKYDIIIDQIKNKEISVKANGIVTLPNEFKHLSDSGECLILHFQDKTAVYFFLYRGIIDSSRGYVYITDEISFDDYINTSLYTANQDFTTIKKIEDKLYLCSTG